MRLTEPEIIALYVAIFNGDKPRDIAKRFSVTEDFVKSVSPQYHEILLYRFCGWLLEILLGTKK